jgi:hypothetical protein
MDEFSNLLLEIYKDAYIQGRKDGLEGLYIEPQLVFNHYLTDQQVATKLSELGYLTLTYPAASDIDLH